MMGVVLAMTSGVMAKGQNAARPTSLWTLKRDHTPEHHVKFPSLQRLERTHIRGNAHGRYLTGRFQDATLADGKKSDARFTGEILGGKTPALVLRQQEPRKGAPYVVTHVGHLIAPNHYRGTWYDTDGSSGDFDLALENAGVHGTNVALNKHVTPNIKHAGGRHHARLTDGHWATDAYPNGYAFDYTVNLTQRADGESCDATNGFDVHAIALYWGQFGRHHPGSTGRGSWEGDYVKWFTVEYLDQTDAWHTIHLRKGLPTNGGVEGVRVTRFPAEATVNEGEVLTVLEGLDLCNVVAVRVRAKGGHWIGMHELEVYGTPSEPVATGPKIVNRDPHAGVLESIIKQQGKTGGAPTLQLDAPAASLATVLPVLQQHTHQRTIVAMGEHNGWYWFDISMRGHVFGYFVRKGGRDVYEWSRW